jgi:hypothetical protein
MTSLCLRADETALNAMFDRDVSTSTGLAAAGRTNTVVSQLIAVRAVWRHWPSVVNDGAVEREVRR